MFFWNLTILSIIGSTFTNILSSTDNVPANGPDLSGDYYWFEGSWWVLISFIYVTIVSKNLSSST